mmetsp:Transcript_12662/g.19088  ORF Transcript_12662/g.19088 Transcript_12662/m.19088 type:complete len:89 (-) Transcript_12662:536-802(-)
MSGAMIRLSGPEVVLLEERVVKSSRLSRASARAYGEANTRSSEYMDAPAGPLELANDASGAMTGAAEEAEDSETDVDDESHEITSATV